MKFRKRDFAVAVLFAVACSTTWAAHLHAQDADSDVQWKRFEEAKLNQLIHGIARGADLLLIADVEVTESQMAELREAVEEWEAKLDDVRQRSQQQRLERQVQILIDGGSVAEAKRSATEVDREYDELRNSYNAHVLAEIFVPWQATRLRQLAKRQMLIEKSAAGDEFELPLLIAEDLGYSKDELTEIKKTIDAVRADYHRQLTKVRDETRQRVLDGLPGEYRTRIEEVLGEPYDYQAELDSLRRKQ